MKAIFAVTIISSLLLTACSDNTDKQTSTAQNTTTYTLKVAHFWPSTSLAQKQVLEPWCDKIKEQSNAQLTCQFYPAMQLGGTPPQLIDQVTDGIADIVFTLPGYTANRFPVIEVMELPFLTKTAEQASRVAWTIYEEFAQKEFNNIKPLAFNVHDRGHFHNNKRPITTLDDLQGLKLRAPTRLTNKLLAAFGATPVSIPLPGMTEALSKGVADGYILPWEVIPTVKLHEMTKYHSEVNTPNPVLYTALFTIAMNKQRYENLPDHLKKVIDNNSGADFSASIGKLWDNSAQTAKQKAIDNGNLVNELSTENLKPFFKVADKVKKDWVLEISAQGYDGEKILNRATELLK